MKLRKSTSTNLTGIKEYTIEAGNVGRDQINAVIKKYNEALLELIETRRDGKTLNFEVYTQKARQLKEELIAKLSKFDDLRLRNILSSSNIEHEHIGHGQDNVVFPLGRYVYKESSQEATPEHIEYLRNKYWILKKYLGINIPKTYFVLGESLKKLGGKNKQLANMRYPVLSALTIQKRIKGPNLSQMSPESKQSSDFQDKLEKAHKKYILLKMFLERIHNIVDLPVGILDLKLDLGSLSDKDTIKAELLDTKLLMTPNIMWDGKGVYFIDFDFGIWDNKKQQVFDYLLKPNVIAEWHKILSIYNLE